MDMSHIITIAGVFTVAYIAFLLGLMAWMASAAAKKYPPATSHVPSQNGILDKVDEFATAYHYKKRPEDSVGTHHVYRKGRGWLTSLTDLHIDMRPDGSADIEVKEGVNFFVKMLYFPINASTFLGLPVRQRKVKTINLLLEQLHAPPIAFAKGKGVKRKKN